MENYTLYKQQRGIEKKVNKTFTDFNNACAYGQAIANKSHCLVLIENSREQTVEILTPYIGAN